jgi:hypothetical protein
VSVSVVSGLGWKLTVARMKQNREDVARLDKEYKEMAIRTGYILK